MNNELDLLTPNESGVGSSVGTSSILNTRNQNPERSEFREHDMWLCTAADQQVGRAGAAAMLMMPMVMVGMVAVGGG